MFWFLIWLMIYCVALSCVLLVVLLLVHICQKITEYKATRKWFNPKKKVKHDDD